MQQFTKIAGETF